MIKWLTFLSLSLISALFFGDSPVTANPTDSLNDHTLTENLIIKSEILGYNLQYRVYLPKVDKLSSLPVLYLTDGQWYEGEGDMSAILDELIATKKIRPLLVVLIDNRNPNNLKENRRNSQFLCNEEYVKFIASELVPLIDANYPTEMNRTSRAMMGLSFGGLNAAFVGLNASETFGMIGMQSPALHPCPDIYTRYETTDRLPLKIFMSTGSSNDTETGTRKLKKILEAKQYPMKYMEVNEGHNWRNWKPLLDDVLIYFFGIN